MTTTATLPPDVEQGLERFLAAARAAFGDDLVSAVLFGSAAEGRLRPASDVNLMLVLRDFSPERAYGVREAFRIAHAAIHLEVMFVREDELDDAIAAFPVKFADILARHRVAHGADALAGRTVPPARLREHVGQVLLNLALRLRERYALVSLREEQVAPLVADVAGPLRSCAAAVLRLEGRPAVGPKEALERLVAEAGPADGAELLALVSRSREQGALPAGQGVRVLVGLIGIAQALRARARGGVGGGE